MKKRKKTAKKSNPVAAFLWTNKRQRAKNIFFLLTVFIVVVALGVGYVNSKLNKIDTSDDDNAETAPMDVIYEEEEKDIIEAIDSASSYNNFIYQWATNDGELYSSKNVINVLCIGLDSKDALENGGRSDSLILASLNKKTKKI